MILTVDPMACFSGFPSPDQPHVPLCPDTGPGHHGRLTVVWEGTFLHSGWVYLIKD